MSVGREIKRGVAWTTLERFSAQGMQFVISIVIAQLLCPDDYGLIAVLGIFIGLAQNIVDSGFVNALIQKKEVTEADYSTTFYFNLVAGAVCYVLLFVSAPFIADFYSMPELRNVARVLGLLPVVTALGLVARAQLMRSLKFERLAFAGITAVVLSGSLGLYMAHSGAGVWALVAQTLSKYLFEAVFMWVCSRWTPHGFFSMDSFRVLWKFSSNLLISSIIHTLYENMYTVILGYKYSKADAGLFNRAQTFSMFPALNISTILVKAIYPIQCQIQDDEETQRRVFLDSLRMGSFVVFPLMIGLAVLARPFILVLLKEQWLPAVVVLQLLSLAYMLKPMAMLSAGILSIKGRTDYSLRAEIYKKLAGVGLLLGFVWFGLNSVAVGFLFYSVADVVICSVYVNRVIGVRLWDELRVISPIFLLTGVMGGAIYLSVLWIDSPWVQLTVGSVVGVLSYGCGAWLFRFRAWGLLISTLKRKK